MTGRKEPMIPNDVLDQLLSGTDAAATLSQRGLLNSLKKAFAELTLNAEIGSPFWAGGAREQQPESLWWQDRDDGSRADRAGGSAGPGG